MRSTAVGCCLLASTCTTPGDGSSTGDAGGGATDITELTGEPATTSAESTGEGEPACAVESPEGLMLCVDRARYIADVVAVAEVRTPGSAHWSAVQDRCATSLELAGFVVEVDDFGGGVNVVGTLPGSGAEADEIILLGAHYDHIADCSGADDNASGVAGALEVARVLGAAALRRTIVIACWDQEEVGLQGSIAHAESLAEDAVVVAYNFDMIGFSDSAPDSQVFPGPLAERFPGLSEELAANEYRADFIAGAAEPFALDLEARAESLGRLTGVMTLTAEEKLSEDYSVLARSDHRTFWQRGIPALHVFDTGLFRNSAYHCFGGADTVDTLDHDFAADVIRATVGSMAKAAEVTTR